jgi:hypothetical protein
MLNPIANDREPDRPMRIEVSISGRDQPLSVCTETNPIAQNVSMLRTHNLLGLQSGSRSHSRLLKQPEGAMPRHFNLPVARMPGIELSPSLLAHADKVVE